jgi:hypothetical protein
MSDISQPFAERLVRLELARSEARDGAARMILGAPTETEDAWIFYVHARSYIEDNHLDRVLAGGRIVVPKDGSPLHWTAPPADQEQRIPDAVAAQHVAQEILAARARDGGIDCVLVGEPTDYGHWWVQGYQSRAFVERGDFLQALAGNGPIVVPKDGSEPFALTSAEPEELQMQRVKVQFERLRPID